MDFVLKHRVELLFAVVAALLTLHTVYQRSDDATDIVNVVYFANATAYTRMDRYSYTYNIVVATAVYPSPRDSNVLCANLTYERTLLSKKDADAYIDRITKRPMQLVVACVPHTLCDCRVLP